MKRTIEVTDYEFDTIMQLRAKHRKRIDADAIRFLDLALAYYKWLKDEDMCDSYSVFCDDFGYTTGENFDEDRAETHRIVGEIMHQARVLAGGE